MAFFSAFAPSHEDPSPTPTLLRTFLAIRFLSPDITVLADARARTPSERPRATFSSLARCRSRASTPARTPSDFFITTRDSSQSPEDTEPRSSSSASAAATLSRVYIQCAGRAPGRLSRRALLSALVSSIAEEHTFMQETVSDKYGGCHERTGGSSGSGPGSGSSVVNQSHL